MDNQQEILMSWLACALDCEGTIGFNVRQRPNKTGTKKRTAILPLIQVSNTGWAIIKKCCECADAVGIQYNVTHYTPRGNMKKPWWIFSMAGAKRVGALLPLLMPYLTEKLYCAESVMAFIRSRDGKNTGPSMARTYTDHELQLVQVTRRTSPETTRATPIVFAAKRIG